MYAEGMAFLSQRAFVGGRRHDPKTFDFFNSAIDNETEKRILHAFSGTDTNLRGLICTVAFGMRVDFGEVHGVVHWWLPGSVLSHWQEIGRAGREGKPAKATLYATSLLTLVLHSKYLACMIYPFW